MGFISRGSTVRFDVTVQKIIPRGASNQSLTSGIYAEIRALGHRVISANAKRLSNGIVVMKFSFQLVVGMDYQSEAQLGQQLLGEFSAMGYTNTGIYVRVLKAKLPVSRWF